MFTIYTIKNHSTIVESSLPESLWGHVPIAHADRDRAIKI